MYTEHHCQFCDVTNDNPLIKLIRYNASLDTDTPNKSLMLSETSLNTRINELMSNGHMLSSIVQKESWKNHRSTNNRSKWENLVYEYMNTYIFDQDNEKTTLYFVLKLERKILTLYFCKTILFRHRHQGKYVQTLAKN